MSYGVVPTGFSRKPLAVILAEIESQLITEFGPDVIQTSQSPLGQVNGLMADLISVLWEFAEDVYQSYDPDQAEGTRLEILGRLRLLGRQGAETDDVFRRAITNQGRARIDLQDLTRAILGLEGVTYAQVFVDDGTGQLDDLTLEPGTIVVAVLGGDDEEIAQTARQYIVPGINTFGNTVVSTTVEGYCRTLNLLRPVLIPVEVVVHVRVFNDNQGCAPPATSGIRNALVANLELINGDDLTFYRVRQVIESLFKTVEVLSVEVTRPDASGDAGNTIGFVEMAVLTIENTSVVVDG